MFSEAFLSKMKLVHEENLALAERKRARDKETQEWWSDCFSAFCGVLLLPSQFCIIDEDACAFDLTISPQGATIAVFGDRTWILETLSWKCDFKSGSEEFHEAIYKLLYGDN